MVIGNGWRFGVEAETAPADATVRAREAEARAADALLAAEDERIGDVR